MARRLCDMDDQAPLGPVKALEPGLDAATMSSLMQAFADLGVVSKAGLVHDSLYSDTARELARHGVTADELKAAVDSMKEEGK